jgi:hypothetical protein
VKIRPPIFSLNWNYRQGRLLIPDALLEITKAMPAHHILSLLSLATLGIVLLIAAAGFVYFIRRKSNRDPMNGRQERNIAKDLDGGQEPPNHSPRQ